MGADFAHQAEAGVDGDVQTGFPGDDPDRVPGADLGADVALQAQNLVQAQLHRIDEEFQRQFQLRGGFAFDDPGFHVTLRSCVQNTIVV